MTGHLGCEEHDPAGRGQRLVLRKTMTGVGFGSGARHDRLAVGAARSRRGIVGYKDLY